LRRRRGEGDQPWRNSHANDVERRGAAAKQDADERKEHEAILETYLHALGMI
jgi:Uncharacterized protein conserved in bacteria (DUF2312)